MLIFAERRWSFGLLTILCFVSFTACVRDVSNADIVGKYVLAGPASSKDELDVRENGTYVHSFAPDAHTPTTSDSSTWKLEHHDGRALVVFSGFLTRFRAGQYDADARAAIWPAVPEKSVGGDVSLVVDSDLGWKYVRRP